MKGSVKSLCYFSACRFASTKELSIVRYRGCISSIKGFKASVFLASSDEDIVGAQRFQDFAVVKLVYLKSAVLLKLK